MLKLLKLLKAGSYNRLRAGTKTGIKFVALQFSAEK